VFTTNPSNQELGALYMDVNGFNLQGDCAKMGNLRCSWQGDREMSLSVARGVVAAAARAWHVERVDRSD
jgi:hypothetical protein